jgi:hypothetical protein
MAISLESSLPALLQHEKTQLARLFADVETIKDQMKKVAIVLNCLSEGMAGRQSESQRQISEIALILQSVKAHVDSFPHALREARRSDIATQNALEKLAARVTEIEAKVGTICTQSDFSQVKT